MPDIGSDDGFVFPSECVAGLFCAQSANPGFKDRGQSHGIQLVLDEDLAFISDLFISQSPTYSS